VLHTSLLNITVVAFKVLPLGSYAPMPVPSPPCKTILELVLWNDLQSCCRITPVVTSVIKMPSFQYNRNLREQKKVMGARPGEWRGVSSTVVCLLAKNSLTDSALIQAPTFSRRHTKTHSDNNRRHSERDGHRSTTTQPSTSSNHTEVSVHCCHGKHTVASSRTLLSDLVYLSKTPHSQKNNNNKNSPCTHDCLLLQRIR
jgi:hypothetical protein